jgi:hypothetical protein
LILRALDTVPPMLSGAVFLQLREFVFVFSHALHLIKTYLVLVTVFAAEPTTCQPFLT